MSDEALIAKLRHDVSCRAAKSALRDVLLSRQTQESKQGERTLDLSNVVVKTQAVGQTASLASTCVTPEVFYSEMEALIAELRTNTRLVRAANHSLVSVREDAVQLAAIALELVECLDRKGLL